MLRRPSLRCADHGPEHRFYTISCQFGTMRGSLIVVFLAVACLDAWMVPVPNRLPTALSGGQSIFDLALVVCPDDVGVFPCPQNLSVLVSNTRDHTRLSIYHFDTASSVKTCPQKDCPRAAGELYWGKTGRCPCYIPILHCLATSLRDLTHSNLS